MNKWLLLIGVVIILLVGGFFILNNYIYNEKQGNTMNTQNAPTTTENSIHITPISHATMILNMAGQVIFTDPVGDANAFGSSVPSIILVTDIHGDHLDEKTLAAVSKEDTVIVVPQAVADMLPQDLLGTVVTLANGEKTIQKGIEIEATAMYNMPESKDAPHTKGRGNGYVLDADGKRVYIAGDTGATPQMRSLQNIDIAFIPMNLPYTMSVEEAADGVVAFKPKVVHPYHYRGPQGLADIEKFKLLVTEKDPNIQVALLDFYPQE